MIHPLRAAALALLLLPAASCAQAAEPSKPMPRALWVWDAGLMSSPNRQPEFFSFCKTKGITRLYCSLGDVFSERKVAEGEKRHVTTAQLAAFLRAAHAEGMKVDGLDGDPSFALEKNHAVTIARFTAALDYNKTAATTDKLDGWQWDTEPYLLPDYRKDADGMKTVLTQYLTSVSQMVDALGQTPDFEFGYAIPSFFDTPGRSVEWKGLAKPVAFHLIDMLNTLPNGYVALMSYRDKAEGGNGTIAISSGEVDYATNSASKVKVWIGQETNQPHGTDPTTVTFYEEGEDAMEAELGKINAAFAGRPVVGGIAIHHWAAYKEFPKGPRPAVPAQPAV